MIYGLIICAGKQSRFKSETPKALVSVHGETLLQKNMNAMSEVCDKVFVVCSFENEKYFTFGNKIVINSGKGSGDAVWQALGKIGIKKGDVCFVLWGDAYQSKDIYHKLISAFEGVTLIPCLVEEKPYVQIKQRGENVQVAFSKFGDEITRGYHDLSVFCCDAHTLLEKLTEYRSKILDTKGNYVHKHNNEMDFLDAFNETDIKAKIVVVEGSEDFSFNTVEQFNQLVEK